MACRKHEDKRHLCRILIGQPEGNKQLERPRCRCEDNIKTDLREIEGAGIA
jgi:hypothetical protein